MIRIACCQGASERVIQQSNSPLDEIGLDFIIELLQKIIFYDPVKNCLVKGKRTDWVGLPKSKSLFFARPNCGLPIGNLTSQLFSNIYLNGFDHFVKEQLKGRYYGRYVDDFVIVHPDKTYLKLLISEIRNYLKDNLWLELHEKKIYLQHYSKGVKFLGVFIKPYRIYIANRSKGNFYKKIRGINQTLSKNNNRLDQAEVENFNAAINSYLGLLKPYNTVKLRRKIINSLSVYFWNYFYIKENRHTFKIVKRKK